MYLIIGGGISGLYIANQLKKMNKNFVLFEKTNHIGGKIKTKYNEKHNVLFEHGPWRIGCDHDRFIKLLKSMNIEIHSFNKNIISEFDEIPKNNYSNHSISIYTGNSIMYDIDTANYIEQSSGYQDTHRISNNSKIYDADMKEQMKKYYYVQKGLNHVVQKLYSNIKEYVRLNCFVKDIQYLSGKYICEILERKKNDVFETFFMEFEKIFCCVPCENLDFVSINNLFRPLKSCVGSLDLLHIYSKVDYSEINHDIIKKNNDFHIFTKEINAQFVNIPYLKDYSMIGYISGRNATSLFNLYLSDPKKFDQVIQENVIKMLNKHVKKKISKNIVKKIIPKFYSKGIHYFKPSWNSNPEKITNLSSTGINKVYLPNFHICGESFSNYQGWIEGCLQTCDLALNDVFATKPEKLPKYYVKFQGMIIDTTEWKKHHPGTEKALINHNQEDVELFLENTNHPDYAYHILLNNFHSFV